VINLYRNPKTIVVFQHVSGPDLVAIYFGHGKILLHGGNLVGCTYI
jgi:hypothetical protein